MIIIVIFKFITVGYLFRCLVRRGDHLPTKKMDSLYFGKNNAEVPLECAHHGVLCLDTGYGVAL